LIEIRTRKNMKWIGLVGLLSLALIISACSPVTLSTNKPVGGLWDVTLTNGKMDWTDASNLVQEQHDGFELANQEAKFDEVSFSEGNNQDDVQLAVRKMVEGQTENPKSDPVLAMIGATSNQATSRAAALANFFNVPMIIPSASGDNLLPANNLWAFQLTPPNSAYANYILGTVLNKQTLRTNSSVDIPISMRIAILYEQNTYGENAAVATASAALQQEFEVTTYDKFTAKNPDPALMRVLANEVLDQGAQVVFIISSDPAVAQEMVFTFSGLVDPLAMPLLVGIAGGFSSQDFVNSAQANNVFVLRQQYVPTGCPDEINSINSAQNYAAVKLLEYALKQVSNQPLDTVAKLSLNNSDGLNLYRETVRDIIKGASLDLPCLGRVAFDNNGQNKFAKFEIVMTNNGRTRVITPAEFISAVKQILDAGG
jgi:ABC-type branched-subunit amino acid transport system substrate-binding protein